MPAPAPPAENGAPRSELQELQFRAQNVTDEVNYCDQFILSVIN